MKCFLVWFNLVKLIISYNWYTCSCVAITSTASTSVNIFLIVLRKVYINYCINIINLKSSGCYICCNKKLNLSTSEILYCSFLGWIIFITGNWSYIVMMIFKLLKWFFQIILGINKYNCFLWFNSFNNLS